MIDNPVGRELAALVREQFVKYVAFHSERRDAEADTLTLWTMNTHCYERSDTTPYLYVTAPTPEAGKSRIIDVAELLVARPHVVVDPTPASLFRLIDAEHPTIFIDEADELVTNKGLRAVMNAGFRKGGFVPRAKGEFMVKYDVYGPKLVAGIKGMRLPLKGATLSRCIEVPMRTRLLDGSEPVDDFVLHEAAKACAGIQTSLAEWAASVEIDQHPDLPPGLSDRQRDAWRPLVAVAQNVDDEWVSRAREAALLLREARRPDAGTQLIADMQAVWEWLDEYYQRTGKAYHGSTLDFESTERAWTSTLIEVHSMLDDRQYEGQLTGQTLMRWLSRFDIRPLPAGFRLGGAARKRGYERRAFDDAFKRYIRQRSLPPGGDAELTKPGGAS